MGQIREVDAISDAIVATEREIAGEAWDIEDTDPADETGDRSLESMGEGLEGQHEEGEDAEAGEGSEEHDGEESSEEDGETEGEEAEGEDGEGSEEPEGQQAQAAEPRGRVPSGKLREANERARLAEEERDRLKAQIEGLPKGDPEVAALKAQIATLTQLVQGGQRPNQQQPQDRTESAKPEEAPDIFENPKGFVEHITNIVQQAVAPVRNDMRRQAVETSFALAHASHKDGFTKAYEAVNRLDANNPGDREIVQRIYNSPNPGEALVSWHKRTEALARVGSDPDAYEARIREETRQTLLKDPEFRKALLADLRSEAGSGNNGSPRTQNRLPPSLQRAPGASREGQRFAHSVSDDSEQGVADAAWNDAR